MYEYLQSFMQMLIWIMHEQNSYTPGSILWMGFLSSPVFKLHSYSAVSECK